MAALQTYQLTIHLSQPDRITVGKLGEFEFPAGIYIYTGSAKRHLEARIRRHLSREKTLKWHIDYLLASPHAQITAVERSAVAECDLNQQTPGDILIPKFGASDCKRGCGSHLKYRKFASC